MSTSQGILTAINGEIGSYFTLDSNAKLTPNPFIDEIRSDNLFILDTNTGELTPNNSGVDDDFFELVGGALTPKVL